MNNKFPVLSFVSVVYRIFGFLLLIASLYYFLYEGIVEPRLPNHHFGETDLVELLGGLLGCIVSLGLVATGEVIGVLFAIEKNTRATECSAEQGGLAAVHKRPPGAWPTFAAIARCLVRRPIQAPRHSAAGRGASGA